MLDVVIGEVCQDSGSKCRGKAIKVGTTITFQMYYAICVGISSKQGYFLGTEYRGDTVFPGIDQGVEMGYRVGQG